MIARRGPGTAAARPARGPVHRLRGSGPAPPRIGQAVSGVLALPHPVPGMGRSGGLGRFAHGWGYVIASVLLVRGEAFVDVGGLDEGFFLYAEEADWERRATRAGGRSRTATTRRRHMWERPRTPTPIDAGSDSTPGSRPTCGSGTGRSVGAPTSWRRCSRRCGAPHCPGHRRRPSLALAHLYARGPVREARRAGLIPPRAHRVPALDGDRDPVDAAARRSTSCWWTAPATRTWGGVHRVERDHRARRPGRDSSPRSPACRRGGGPSWCAAVAPPPTASPGPGCDHRAIS